MAVGHKAVNKTVVFGGTFNPVHAGHMAIARCALEQVDPDVLIFLPTGRTAYKEFPGDDMTLHRRRMLELAVRGEPRFGISCREMDSGRVNYTYLTLERMRREDPDSELYFILGGDSLKDLPKWRFPERICAAAVILVAARRDDSGDAQERLTEETAERYRGDFRRLDTPLLDVSSSEIRRRVKEGLDISGMVPPSVEEYIYENGLYL